MTEIFSIITQLIIFLFLTLFPVNNISTPFLYKSLGKSNFFCIPVNILILLFIFLICSFFSINLRYVFFLIFVTYLLIFFNSFYKICNEILNKDNLSLKFFFITINLFFFFDLAYNLEIGWDGLAIWIFKANNFYNGHSYFKLFEQEIIYKQYPHLGSYSWAFFWKNSLIEKEYFGRLFYQYIYVVSIFVIANSIKIFSNLKIIITIFCLILLSQDYDNTLQGYQDYLLFSLLIFSGKLIQTITSRNNSNNSLLNNFFLLSILIIPWIKNEGVFYSIFLVILFFLSKTTFLMKLIFSLLVILNIGSHAFIIKFIYKLESLYQFSFNTILLLFKNFDISNLAIKISFIFLYLFHGFIKYPITILYLFGILYVIKHKKITYQNKFFLFFFFMQFLFIFGIYILSNQDLVWHLQTSIKRLILQTSGFYLFISIWVINNFGKKLFQ
jgi:hypothetical protein